MLLYGILAYNNVKNEAMLNIISNVYIFLLADFTFNVTHSIKLDLTELKTNFVQSRLCYFYYYGNPDIKYAFGSMWCDAGKAIYCLNFIITPMQDRGQFRFCSILILPSIK